MYNAAEKLFGFIPTEYPDLERLQRELALLQKLYGLYNDVMRSVNNYYDIKWTDLKIPKINNELQGFRKRCRRLPKALRDWPAYSQLKKTIDDFNQLCPLLELMNSKCMKDRHWDLIGDITDYKFNFENENFSLKHVMEAPLLKFYPEVEDVCLCAQREKEIEGILKQTVLDWSVVPLSLGHYKNRGEILLREQEAEDIMKQLEVVLATLNDLLVDRYSMIYRRELHARIADFTNVYDTVKRWLKVQNIWLELGNIFVGGDIARQLPLEAKKYDKTHKILSS
jgi:dynein heavy chain